MSIAEIGNAFIEHYGVKGMRWGVRKKRSSSSNESADITKMSNKELQDLVTRMNLEQQYSRLSSSPRQRGLAAAGAAFAGSLALGIARQQIQGQANQRISNALRRRAARESAVRGLRKLG